MGEEQRRFVEFWYRASVFANRYSTATNEVIITDSQALTQIAHGERIVARGYFRRLRSLIAEPSDLYSFTRRASLTYRGVLNLLAYAASGLHDWSSTRRIGLATSDLDDHHIYPRAFIASRPELDIDNDEMEFDEPTRLSGRDRLPDMLADGRVQLGDRVYAVGHPDKVATIASSNEVTYEGRRLAINAWGQQVTGWASINIYANVYLERTGKPLGTLRAQPDQPE